MDSLVQSVSGGGLVRTDSLVVGGRQRSYRLYQPAGYAPERVIAVVLVLHGGLSSGAGVARQTGFDRQAEEGSFLAVYPDGIGRTWNAGYCCGPARREGIDDVAFVAALLDHLATRYPIDSRRVYATGLSNGGMLAYRLACELSERIAAIGPVAATMIGDCQPSRAVSVLHIHGTADQNVLYGGGRGPRSLEPRHDPAVTAVVERWRALDGCTSAGVIERAGAVTRQVGSDCRDGASVRLYTIEGGGHSWPGGDRLAAFLDPPSPALDATAALWEFFAAHPGSGR